MKSALAQFAILLIEFKENPFFEHGTIKFIGTISEELTEQGAAYLADHGFVDDLDCLIVGEPTGVPINEGKAYFATGGAKIDPDDLTRLKSATANFTTSGEQHFIVTSHKGWMSYTVTSHGKAAHSSMPALGINAISNLVDYYVAERELYASFTESNPTLGKTVYSPGIFEGGKQVNSVPSLASEQVKVRTIPELPNQELIRRLKGLVARLNQRPHFKLEINVQFSEVPVVNNGSNLLANALKQGSGTNLNEAIEMPTIGVSYGTDASEFRRKNDKMEIVILGCGNTTAHRVDEYVTMNAYLSFNRQLRQALTVYAENFSKVMN
jgi:succinyl-diaminopimelate desuccinylase